MYQSNFWVTIKNKEQKYPNFLSISSCLFSLRSFLLLPVFCSLSAYFAYFVAFSVSLSPSVSFLLTRWAFSPRFLLSCIHTPNSSRKHSLFFHQNNATCFVGGNAMHLAGQLWVDGLWHPHSHSSSSRAFVITCMPETLGLDWFLRPPRPWKRTEWT